MSPVILRLIDKVGTLIFDVSLLIGRCLRFAFLTINPPKYSTNQWSDAVNLISANLSRGLIGMRQYSDEGSRYRCFFWKKTRRACYVDMKARWLEPGEKDERKLRRSKEISFICPSGVRRVPSDARIRVAVTTFCNTLRVHTPSQVTRTVESIKDVVVPVEGWWQCRSMELWRSAMNSGGPRS